MTKGRPRWTFEPTPSGRRPPETGGQFKLLQSSKISTLFTCAWVALFCLDTPRTIVSASFLESSYGFNCLSEITKMLYISYVFVYTMPIYEMNGLQCSKFRQICCLANPRCFTFTLIICSLSHYVHAVLWKWKCLDRYLFCDVLKLKQFSIFSFLFDKSSEEPLLDALHTFPENVFKIHSLK